MNGEKWNEKKKHIFDIREQLQINSNNRNAMQTIHSFQTHHWLLFVASASECKYKKTKMAKIIRKREPKTIGEYHFFYD